MFVRTNVARCVRNVKESCVQAVRKDTNEADNAQLTSNERWCRPHNRGPFLFATASMLSTRLAVIFRPARSAMTSGRRRGKWVLRFERCASPYTEPLMGWTSNDDPLASLELRFNFLASAVRYAERD